MLRRPKPTDSEADLLEQQQKFLTAGSRSVTVVKRTDKRRGDVEAQENRRDVVTIEGEL